MSEEQSKKKITGGALLSWGLFSLGLALASVWPIQTMPALSRAAGHAVFLYAACVLFFLILPKRMKLPMQIFVAMMAGIIAGWGFKVFGDQAFITDYLGIFGTLFILMLKVVVIPLIFVSIVCGVAGVGDTKKLGRLGLKTIVYYMLTTAIAVIIGLSIVNALQPGKGRAGLQEIRQENTAEIDNNLGVRIQKDMLPTVIQNPIMSGQNPLVIIFFAIILGIALANLGKEGEAGLKVFQSFDKAFTLIIMGVMYLAPIGVFALMAKAIAELGIEYVITLAKYFFTVLLGLGTHFCVLTFLIIPVFGRIRPLRFLRGMIPAFEVSFSTSSSSATLPVTIRCVSDRVGADRNISNFMLPIGATVNMDGTALYLTVASIFIAQVYGIDLGLKDQIMVFFTAVLMSVGTAGIPGASIGLMSIILASAGIPVEGIGIVIGVDRLLDMCRTVVNITGDSTGAIIISRGEGLLHAPQLESNTS